MWLTLTPSNRSTIRIVEGGPAIETMPHFSLLPSAMSHVCVLGDYGGTHDGQCVRCTIVYIHIYVLLYSSTVYHYCILNLFSWYLVTFLLAPLDSFLFTCAHLPQPSCHGCEPLHRLLDSEGKKNVWLVAWSPNGICSPAPKVLWSGRCVRVCVCVSPDRIWNCNICWSVLGMRKREPEQILISRMDGVADMLMYFLAITL